MIIWLVAGGGGRRRRRALAAAVCRVASVYHYRVRYRGSRGRAIRSDTRKMLFGEKYIGSPKSQIYTTSARRYAILVGRSPDGTPTRRRGAARRAAGRRGRIHFFRGAGRGCGRPVRRTRDAIPCGVHAARVHGCIGWLPGSPAPPARAAEPSVLGGRPRRNPRPPYVYAI
jgi:hypothetical protein